MTKIAVDFDGVIGKFNEAFLILFNEIHSDAFVELSQITDYDMAKSYNTDAGKIDEMFTKFTDKERWVTMNTYDAWIKVINRLYAEGNELHGMTARSTHHGCRNQKQKTRKQTYTWLDNTVGLHIFNSVSFERNKLELCDHLGIEFLIDDAPRYAQEAKSGNFKVKVLTPRRPWNEGFDIEHVTAYQALEILGVDLLHETYGLSGRAFEKWREEYHEKENKKEMAIKNSS